METKLIRKSKGTGGTGVPIKINQHLEGDTDYEDNEDNKDDDVSEKDNQINRDEIKVWNEEVKELLN